jgi:hypothetical protein
MENSTVMIARHLAICFLLFFSSAMQVSAEEVVVPENPQQFHLFLLVGQSNMAGRGAIEDQDKQTNPRVLMLNKENEWALAKDPLHFDKPGMVGVGLGKTFALDYAEEHPDVTVGLIPCAVGGSPIAAWEPGGYHDQTKSHPWDDCLPRAKLALQSGVLKGILWHQGESDSTEKLAPQYEKKLHALIARFRDELNAPDVSFIAGQMGQFAEKPWSESRKQVDAAHRTLPEKVAQTAFVSSDELHHKGDNVHFDSASYREFGHRYYQAYQALVEKVSTQKAADD